MILERKGEASFGAIVAMIGSILVACGVAWLLAYNWHQIPAALKIIILGVATAAAYTSGIILRTHDYPKIGKSLIVLGASLYTLSIFLIAQIFSLGTSLQENAFLLLLAWAGVYTTSYIFDSGASLIVALIEFLFWIGIQYLAFFQNNFFSSFSVGFLAILYLLVGILFYGLSLAHKSKDHDFAPIYRWWTALYFLAFTYILSFQTLLPLLWPSGVQFSSGSLIFTIVLAIIAVVSAVAGTLMALNGGKVRAKEIIGFISVGILLVVLIVSASMISGKLGSCSPQSCYDLSTKQQCTSTQLPQEVCKWQDNRCIQESCYNYQNESACRQSSAALKCMWDAAGGYGRCLDNQTAYDGKDPVCNKHANERSACLDNSACKWNPQYYYGQSSERPLSMWFLWIFANLIFLGLILLLVGYGTWQHSTELVNLSISFFVLDIITRYIGFIIDLGWYTSMSVIFITGGIILIVGGWLIEKWRRQLIEKARSGRGTKGSI